VSSSSRNGNRRAVVFGDRLWSYEELAAEVERCARALVAAGIGKGSRVGILLGARPEFAVLAYATAKVGGVCALISTFSTPDELDWIIRHSDAALLVLHAGVRGRAVAAEFADHHPAVRAAVPGAIVDADLPYLRRVAVVANDIACPAPGMPTWEEFLALGDGVPAGLVAARAAQVVPDDDALMVYTSGSTSTPKCVLHMHRAPTMQAFRMADAMAIGPTDRTFSTFPPFWTAGWVGTIAGPLMVGACTVLQEFFDPDEALDLIERERVTCLRQMVHDEVRLTAAQEACPHDLSSIEVGIVTEALRVHTSTPPDISEFCGWGMSETFTNATVLALDEPLDLRTTTMGRPVPGTVIRIRNRESGDALGPNELGEITVAGATLMRGYYKSDPMLPVDEHGFLLTNDAGYLRDDGLLVYAGRLDRLIKTAGANVSPVEIEEQLRAWGRLGTSTVLGLPHPSAGAAVVLCATRHPGDEVTASDVLAHLRTKLSSYKVPRAVVFIAESDVPTTASGKVHVPRLEQLVTRTLIAGDIDAEWRAHLVARATPGEV
jgi:fatty-acyl-CoA synthase